MSLCWTLLFFTSAFLISAHAERRCSPPPAYRRLRPSVKTTPGRSFGHLDTVHYVCVKGFTLAGGPATVQCVDGTWTQLAGNCEKAKANCSAPAVANAVQNGSHVPVYKQGDKVTIVCPKGLRLVGARRLTCGPRGTWKPQLPQCVSVLTEAGGGKARTCQDRQRTQPGLKCEPMMCGSAGEIENGMFTYTGVEFGDTATAVCNGGYNLVGKGTRHCMSKGWDGRVPVCEAVTCPDPQETSAKRKDRRQPPHSYRSVISYQCGAGTLIGQREIWCTANGTWNTAPPTCQEITCPSPNVEFGFWRLAEGLVYRYRHTVSIHCEPGYALIGPHSITCGPHGQWLPSLPTCQGNTWG